MKEIMEYGKGPFYRFSFEKDSRTVRTRNYIFTQEEMRAYRIRGVFNSIGEMDVMSETYIEDYANRVCNIGNGEIAAIETSIMTFPIEGKYVEKMVDGILRQVPMRSNPLKVVSVIVFKDEFSWNIFVMKNSKLYKKDAFLNLLN